MTEIYDDIFKHRWTFEYVLKCWWDNTILTHYLSKAFVINTNKIGHNTVTHNEIVNKYVTNLLVETNGILAA